MTESLFTRCATLRRCPLRRLAPSVRRPQPPKRSFGRYFRKAGIGALLLAGTACEIVEEDISGRCVEIVGPAAGATVPAGETLFRWRAVERAAGYELCVTTEGRIVADTLLAADTLGLARSCGCRLRLEAGRYEWTVAAFNSGYETRSATLHLTVAEEPEPEMPEEDGSSTPHCGVGSTPPPHAADCTVPRFVQLLRRRRTAPSVEQSAPKYGQWSALRHNAPQP